MPFIIALDQGTTSSRAIVFDHAGNVVSSAQREFRQIFPQPGWVEHDAVEIWACQSGVLAEVLAKAGTGAADIAAIGITNQRETTVSGSAPPATRSPLPSSGRTGARRRLCDQLREAGHAALFARKTGLVLDAYFSGTKVKWLLDNVPGARASAPNVANSHSARSTPGWCGTSPAGARTARTRRTPAARCSSTFTPATWDDELLALLDVPRALLPTVVPSSGICGHATIDGVDIPIAGMAGDQQAALFGQACLSAGLAKNTYGTGCFMLLNTGAQAVMSRNNLLTTVAWQRSGVTDYALEGSVFMRGAVVQWLRDGLKIIRTSAEVEALAGASTTTAASTWCPPSRGSARRTGMHTRAERSSA